MVSIKWTSTQSGSNFSSAITVVPASDNKLSGCMWLILQKVTIRSIIFLLHITLPRLSKSATHGGAPVSNAFLVQSNFWLGSRVLVQGLREPALKKLLTEVPSAHGWSMRRNIPLKGIHCQNL